MAESDLDVAAGFVCVRLDSKVGETCVRCCVVFCRRWYIHGCFGFGFGGPARYYDKKSGGTLILEVLQMFYSSFASPFLRASLTSGRKVKCRVVLWGDGGVASRWTPQRIRDVRDGLRDVHHRGGGAETDFKVHVVLPPLPCFYRLQSAILCMSTSGCTHASFSTTWGRACLPPFYTLCLLALSQCCVSNWPLLVDEPPRRRPAASSLSNPFNPCFNRAVYRRNKSTTENVCVPLPFSLPPCVSGCSLFSPIFY